MQVPAFIARTFCCTRASKKPKYIDLQRETEEKARQPETKPKPKYICILFWFRLAGLCFRRSLSLYVLYRDIHCTESDGRKGLPAGDKNRGDDTHTARRKTECVGGLVLLWVVACSCLTCQTPSGARLLCCRVGAQQRKKAPLPRSRGDERPEKMAKRSQSAFAVVQTDFLQANPSSLAPSSHPSVHFTYSSNAFASVNSSSVCNPSTVGPHACNSSRSMND
jgi:hypothetical protein